MHSLCVGKLCAVTLAHGMSSHWSTKADWMRQVGATDATWSADNDLLSLKLGPVPTVPDTETQPSISPQERQRRERLERRDLVVRSSGGPVLKLDADH